MELVRGLKRRLRSGVPAAVFVALVAYFVWNAARGDLGLRAYDRRQADMIAARASLKAADDERDGWQQRMTALQPAHLDADALDERARQMLNLAGSGDVVVPAKN